jgi:hypothetical protein
VYGALLRTLDCREPERTGAISQVFQFEIEP